MNRQWRFLSMFRWNIPGDPPRCFLKALARAPASRHPWSLSFPTRCYKSDRRASRGKATTKDNLKAEVGRKIPMAASNLAVLHALDTARTQWYHVTTIVIAGMGFFTDAYDLFCISTVSKLLGRLYYFDPSSPKPGKLPVHVNNMVIGVALVGTLAGQLFFGLLGDKLGRKRVYGVTLILMAICAIGSGLSFGSTAKSVMNTLCFFRFWLGFGIGGDSH